MRVYCWSHRNIERGRGKIEVYSRKTLNNVHHKNVTNNTHTSKRTQEGARIVLFLRVARVVWDTQKKERKKGPIVVLFLRVARVTWG